MVQPVLTWQRVDSHMLRTMLLCLLILQIQDPVGKTLLRGMVTTWGHMYNFCGHEEAFSDLSSIDLSAMT